MKPKSLLLSILIFSSIIPFDVRANGTIRGFVKDQANGETMQYVNVVIVGTTLGDVSDENGYFVISRIPPGSYSVKAMMIGYETGEHQVTIGLGRTVAIDFHLKESALQAEEIVKTAERERFERQIELSSIQISPRELKAAPAFIEADLFRTLQALPGVHVQTDFSSALYIRGGNPSENLILLDDVRIYNPYHLGGVFSTFNTDAIKNVDLSVGGFPPRFGNATSSVISITNRDGNSKEFAARGSVSLLSSKITLESPIPRGSALISARRTYFDYLYNTFIRPNSSDKNTKFPYYFYDFHGKINYNIAQNSKITLSGFYGDDVLHFEEKSWEYNPETGTSVERTDATDIRFGNSSTTLKWQYIFNPKLFSEFILAHSRFRTFLETTHDDKVEAKDEISDWTAKSDMTWYLSDRHEIKIGLDAQRLAFTMYFKVENFEWLAYKDDKSRYANFFSSYIQDDWKVSPLFDIQSGIRFTYYDLGNYFRADPRFSVRYRAQHNINLKASVGVYRQYFYTFNPEDFDVIRLVDLWFPIDQRYPPIRAIHYIAGLEYWPNDDYYFSVESYYKDYDDLLDLNEVGREDVEIDDFLRGYGRSSGIEFLLRKQRGKLIGWIGYTLAFAEKTIEKPRASNTLGKSFQTEYMTYVANYDRRHSLKMVVSYQQSPKWTLSSSFTYGSGLPETPTLGWKQDYRLDEAGNIYGGDYYSKVPVKARKNSKRLPPYLRLDISVQRNFSFKNWSMQPFLQILNVTNHQNILFYDYDLETYQFDPYGNLVYRKPQRKGIAMFPILPTIGVNFEF